MDVYEAIYSRRTIRDFQDKEIDLDLIKKILNAGLQAPSPVSIKSICVNMVLY